MVKKRQADSHDHDCSTDSGNEDLHHRTALGSPGQTDGATPTTASCQHIKKAVDAARLRRLLKSTGLLYECSQCQKLGKIADSGAGAGEGAVGSGGNAVAVEFDSTLWLCLKCGSQLCGRARHKHALEHYQTPHSDSHALAMNTRSFDIWCYECDMKICSNLRKNLLECVELVKKLAQKPPTATVTPSTPTISYIEQKIKSTLEHLTPIVPMTGGSFDDSSGRGSLAAGGGGVGLSRNRQVAIPLPPPEPSSLLSTSDSLTSVPGMAKRIDQYSATTNGNTGNRRLPTLETPRIENERLPRVRGLTNLGNTCFFNAVMQCLAQTPFLLSVLKELSEPGEEFILPGGTFTIKDKGDIELPMIKGILSSWGGLTAALANALEELQAGGGVFTPRKLFDRLCVKCPQFTGGDQHDAHELLRQLLESVRNEDLKRYQRVILQNLGYKDQDVNSVSEEMRQKCKIYGNQAGDRILRPEQVFRGFLVSTLTCQDCHNVSSRHEYFLDMSLPVAVEKPQPPQRRKPSPELSLTSSSSNVTPSTNQPTINTKFTDGSVNFTASSSSFYLHTREAASLGPSKSQVKKEKERQRKAKRAAKKRHKTSLNLNGNDSGNGNELAESVEQSGALLPSLVDGDGQANDDLEQTNGQTEDSTSTSVTTSEHSDADVEDNLVEDTAAPSTTNVSSSSASMTAPSKTYMDSNGNGQPPGEKRDDTPEHMDKDSIEEDENDSGIATSPAPTATNSSTSTSATGNNNSVAEPGLSGSSGALEDPLAPASLVTAGLSEKGASVIRQVSVGAEQGASNGIADADGEAKATEQPEKTPSQAQAMAQAQARTKRVRTQSYSDWSTTIAPRYQCEDGECSVQSCLNNFTAVELMTGQNKVGCDSCTQRINGSDPKAKSVNTNATKQLLVSSPPAVLILHLKRFQLGPRCIFRKLTRPVSYPNLLDIAAFCGSKVKNLPNIDRKQKKLLYALYGVVEHSGGMYGGHYTAYVKVRPKVAPGDKRWKFLPHGSKAELDQDDDQLKKLEELLAKEKAREQHLKTLDDSDDFSNSSSNSSTSDESHAPATPLEEQQTQQTQQLEEAANVSAPPGKWYYVSDSRVQEVSEDTALKAQAYLLFYERIY
ncbi:ubiquitin carboxyl-terminal hydrolase 16 [Drosophila simulans]|uniref:ubiquitin carboxyl-terminal hydrolase 16 n=1 Tax=Drosophila simulans TaxID=7240 RepID=UPI00192CE644|nr:ubiquitin carboxyl-terminal hydrolase 16 [Drosophila simulans]XP_039153209.1 ubiquitin carboxyl-terminal hydrolase 16 [Drosophila simulans]XP_044779581.1 ubiquitin carboxyl-terminal hydrolase 16 [Drosophila simulans]